MATRMTVDRLLALPSVAFLLVATPLRAAPFENVRGVAFYRADQDQPAATVVGVVHASRRTSSRFSPVTWSTVHDSIADQARSLDADLVLHLVSGESDPRDGAGMAKWVLGLAAISADRKESKVEPCAECIVAWAGLQVGPSGDGSDTMPDLDAHAFAIGRVKLGERGYYLVAPGDGPAIATSPAPSRDGEPNGSYLLTLESLLARRSQEDSLARGVVFESRLAWTVSDTPVWEASIPWTSRGTDADSPGAGLTLEARTALVSLYDQVPMRARPGDSDKDGVSDSQDREPNTPQGAEVDWLGIARDDDGDGVPNGIDRDPRSPRGAMVDMWGVPTDADRDGVDDSRDRCPHTPTGVAVNEEGCPIDASTIEAALVDVGVFQATLIHFQPGRATLLAESFPHLDLIGTALSDLPALKFAVEGHCDDRGDDAFNQRLSEQRADAVIAYLLQRFPKLSVGQFVAQGFGKTRPLAAGRDEAARALNRRVEFRVLEAGR